MTAFRFNCPSFLETPRLTLRVFQKRDNQALYTAVRESAQALMPYLPWCHPDYALQDAEDWISFAHRTWQDCTQFAFVIENKMTRQLVGGCGLDSPTEVGSANLGYWLRTSQTCKGYATEAARHLANVGLTQLGLQQIDITMSVTNKASEQVAIRCGAVFQGRETKALWLHGTPHDTHHYALRHPSINFSV
ncbi:MAG: GNAT family N-acetyltransferase [Pseudomonadales bacterium]|jgi:ribosomal-protein-serine acetyltransferase|nr:GNAT family N-acetyltransferase [Pseudomonadales bacterium]MDA0957356.1 GNAT family protein [Pseudomonadota bacterium]MDA1206726.1 GNAT family protein [Pseudomonadota bacterium]